jgi:hypothetical protein
MTHNLVKTYLLNPKAISLEELYGGYDLNTREWTDGILSSLMRAVSSDEKPDEVSHRCFFFLFSFFVSIEWIVDDCCEHW